MKILNFGSLNLDYVYNVPHFPAPGETVNSTEMAVHAGGKGLNQSVALRRAGAEVYHAGCVGKGGEGLKELLDALGVDTRFLQSVDVPQGSAVIQVEPGGENCISLFGGSNRAVTREQIQKTLNGFAPGDWVVLQNEIDRVPEIIEEAYRRGLRTALNPSPFDGHLKAADYGKLHWLFLNEVEARQLTGEADPEAAWAALHGKYPGLSVLITLGELGSESFAVRGENTEHARVKAIPTQAVDTTGAGDTYTGYFLTGLTQGLPLRDAMERASMAAALAVSRPGAAESIPEKAEVDAALAALQEK